MRFFIGCLAAVGLTTAAAAQQGGSTYPEGSNLPQRTAGEVGAKPAGQKGGSAGPSSSSPKAKKAPAKKKKSDKPKADPNRAPFHR